MTPPGLAPGRAWQAAALALKLLLAVLLLFALTHTGWERFADKAMGARAVLYPLAALVVLAVWLLRRRRGPYPWDVDALLVAPFVIDVAGNAANLYDTVTWFDDACHFVNWALLGAAAGAALLRGAQLPPWATAVICAGLGAVAAILWELAEYGAFILDTPESVGIYRDTLGDEALGLAGATLAGLLTAARVRRAGRPGRSPAPGGPVQGGPVPR
jgi:hypothetical protein